jgi:diguanylate cyclase (GGDEF)-like protein
VQIGEIRQESFQSVRGQLSAAQSSFDKLSQNFYNDENDYLARILYLLDRTHDGKERRLWREEVLNRLYPAYRSATLFGLDQFQLIDWNGRSFLRFHYSQKYGDALAPIRPSVRALLKEKRFLKGFEVGRYVDGFRYLYPLFYDGEFVGGYEWVWSHEALVRELRRIYGGRYALLVERKRLERIVLPGEVRRRYAGFSACDAYLYARNAMGLFPSEFRTFLARLFTERKLCTQLRKQRDLAFLVKERGRDFLVTALALKNLAGEPYGYLIAVQPEHRLAAIDRLFLAEVLFLLVALALIYLLLYRSYQDQLFVRTLIDSQKEIVILTDGEKLQDANRAFLDFFGVRSLEEFVALHRCICNLFIEKEGYLSKEVHGESWIAYLERHPDENRVMIHDRHRDEDRIFSLSLSRFDEKGLYVIVFRDITELERESRHFKLESTLDHLTRLYNKRAFEHYAREKLQEIRHLGREDVALVMFDIDHFKSINDRYGHQRGDRVLRNLSAAIRSSVRQNDFLARWGGEEFVIVMDGASLENACKKAERLRCKIAETNLGAEGNVTCSFGVTLLRPDDTLESAMERVDRLLYRAKRAGRNRVACPEEEIGERAE